MPMKIFDLAKELDMGALDLVESLKTKGFAVRNHMSSLTDEEVTQVREEFKAKTEAAGATKKKATVRKKKTVKKKVVKKVSATSESEGTDSVEKPVVKKKAESATDSKKTVTRKKKTSVIRKKAGDSENDEASSMTLAEKFEVESISEAKDSDKSNTADSSDFGLRIVSRPEAKASSEVKVDANSESEMDDTEPELYREKVHKFTPVFIPEKDESEDDDVRTHSRKIGASVADEDDDSDPADKKKDDGKKRLGGLATMMSGKKPIASKSQALQQSRSEQELKSYATLSALGRPIYSTVKKKKTYAGPTKDTEITETKESKRVVKIHDAVTIQDLAKKLKVKLKDMVDACLDLNLLIKAEDYVGVKLATEIANLYQYRVENVAFDEEKVIGKVELSEDEANKLPLRDPIITIMGHVDHGKTTLLDYIRNAKVADGEAGGITQHIGAYSVKTKSGKTLTFLDTPGHAAFGAMRQRGADITDIVILVVAADDGVMPQTRESVKYIQNAGAPLIVAINKMDKEGANPDRIKNELTEFHITPEEWGGETMMVPISALNGDGVDDLLESLALQAEMLELRADPKGKAEGIVIESKIEQGRGPVATVLVQTGTLKKGDSIVVGETYGRARSLMDHLGNQLQSAGPSIPVQILGLDSTPTPGDTLHVVKNEREAKKIAENRISERKSIENVPVQKQVSLEDFFAAAPEEGSGTKDLNLIIRSDVQGSFEAIKNSLETLSNKEVQVKVLSGGVGPISESDVNLAISSKAIIMGFNMRPNNAARKLAEDQGVEVRTYSIIYELINEVKLAMEGMLEPETIEKYIGRVEVKETFSVPKIGTIAGSIVIDGAIKVGCQVRLLRDGKIVFDGKMSSLKRFKDDVKEVKSGYECGVGLEGYNDVRIGDVFEAYIMEEKKRTLEDVTAAERADGGEAPQYL